MRRTIIALLLALWLALLAAVSHAAAAPITCPSPQVAVHDGDGWHCLNNGGNYSGADETKNPND